MKVSIALAPALALAVTASGSLPPTPGSLSTGQVANRRAIPFGHNPDDGSRNNRKQRPASPVLTALELIVFLATAATTRTDRTPTIAKRKIFEIDSSCSKSQQTKITQGAKDAVSLAESTSSLKKGGAPFSDFFLPGDLNSVNSVFTRVKKAISSNSVQLYISCSTTDTCARPGVVGYADYTTSKITFCPEFFNQPSLHDVDRSLELSYRRNIGQSFLHEAVHVLGGSAHITDVKDGYGYRNGKALKAKAAKGSVQVGPVKNADSYAWFATASYFGDK